NLDGIRRRQPPQGPRYDVSVAVRFELERAGRTFPVLYGFKIGNGRARPSFAVQQEVLRTPPEVVGRGLVAEFERSQDAFRCARLDLHPATDSETLVFPLIAGSHETWKTIIEALRLISVHQFSAEA